VPAKFTPMANKVISCVSGAEEAAAGDAPAAKRVYRHTKAVVLRCKRRMEAWEEAETRRKKAVSLSDVVDAIYALKRRQLEPAPRLPDPYDRPRPNDPPPIETEGLADAPTYEIERLLDRRITANSQPEYFVK
ncbi:MAG: hypothetical protein Q9196_006985, partial [Gyalolechia fulgens]